MINRRQLLGIVYVLILVLSTLISYHLVFIILSILAVYLGISQFLIDKKEKKTSLNYVRKDIPVWKLLVTNGINIAVTVTLTFLGFDKLFDNLIFFYLIFALLGLIFEGVHSNFYQSLRSYPEGFKMPGRKSPLVPWSEVDEMEIVKDAVEIKLQYALEIVDVDRRDLKYLPKIVDTWKNSRA